MFSINFILFIIVILLLFQWSFNFCYHVQVTKELDDLRDKLQPLMMKYRKEKKVIDDRLGQNEKQMLIGLCDSVATEQKSYRYNKKKLSLVYLAFFFVFFLSNRLTSI